MDKDQEIQSPRGSTQTGELAMPSNFNCQMYMNGRCTHPAAPRKLFGLPLCILEFPSGDRRVPHGCALQYPYERPAVRPNLVNPNWGLPEVSSAAPMPSVKPPRQPCDKCGQ